MLALIPLRAWLIAGACVAALAGLGLFIKHERDIGAQKLAEEINQQNQEARNAALSGIRDVDACYAAGGMWSVRDDKCQRP